MLKSYYYLFFCVIICLASCNSQPSKVELMRLEKQKHDSIQYVQAKQNIRYSDSLLQELSAKTDPLMKSFVYSKNEKAEDHGHYVHRLLQTSANTSRNFLQAYVADNRITSVQSYYFGSKQQQQRLLRVSVGEDYIEKEGSNHAFNAEGWHEIMTIEGENAIQILAFIDRHADDKIQVRSVGNHPVTYFLSQQEKNALAETYQLAALMSNIDALERAIHVSNLQVQKYEKKHTNCK